MTSQYPTPSRGSQLSSGFTIIELLVSLLIFSIGLLGYIGLSTRMQISQQEITQRVYGTQLANFFSAQLVADPALAQQIQATTRQWDSLLQDSGLVNARSCLNIEAGSDQYLLAIAWQGLAQTSAEPVSSCGAGDFGSQGLRRVISRSISLPLTHRLNTGGKQ